MIEFMQVIKAFFSSNILFVFILWEANVIQIWFGCGDRHNWNNSTYIRLVASLKPEKVESTAPYNYDILNIKFLMVDNNLRLCHCQCINIWFSPLKLALLAPLYYVKWGTQWISPLFLFDLIACFICNKCRNTCIARDIRVKYSYWYKFKMMPS